MMLMPHTHAGAHRRPLLGGGVAVKRRTRRERWEYRRTGRSPLTSVPGRADQKNDDHPKNTASGRPYFFNSVSSQITTPSGDSTSCYSGACTCTGQVALKWSALEFSDRVTFARAVNVLSTP